jgi:hypothetical protein
MDEHVHTGRPEGECVDATRLLEQDHRTVEQLFSRFEDRESA